MTNEDQRPAAIALMGPTASGKTAMALALVERGDFEIISVDSALVYRRMNIGTAKPDAATLARAPHRLIDVRDPHQTFSAADFACAARVEMDHIAAAGRVPLLVGGTGLYFRALLRGLSPMPGSDAKIRSEIEAEAAARGWSALHTELARVDELAATRIHPGDTQRIQRALEVNRLTGEPISAWQNRAALRRVPFRVLKWVLAPSRREVLHARIAKRFDAMLEAGFVDEVVALRADALLSANSPAMRAVGYRQAWAYLDGAVDAWEFRNRAIAATRQLAKRQITWLRSELDARWIDPDVDFSRFIDAVAMF